MTPYGSAPGKNTCHSTPLALLSRALINIEHVYLSGKYFPLDFELNKNI